MISSTPIWPSKYTIQSHCMSLVDKHAILIFLFLNENCSVPPEAEIYSLLHSVLCGYGPSQHPHPMGTGVLSLGAQWQVRGQVKSARNNTCVSVSWCLMKYWAFTFVPLKAYCCTECHNSTEETEVLCFLNRALWYTYVTRTTPFYINDLIQL